jgi:perosamine synthetase
LSSPIRLQPSAATPLSQSLVWRALSNQVLTPAKEDFGATLVRLLGMQTGVAFSSLMRSTYAAVAAIKQRCAQGATIILPRYSCPSFIHGIHAADMPFRYCDTDPDTLSVRIRDLQEADDGSVGAVLIPNLFGLSADMPEILEFCTHQNWLLLEGADYTLGGCFAGRPLGSFGHFSILNFQEGKALPIGGGMALSQFPGAFTAYASGPLASSWLAFPRSLAYSLLIRPSWYGVFSAVIAKLGVAKKQFSMEDTIRQTSSEFDFTVDGARLAERISSYQANLGRLLLSNLDRNVQIRNDNAFALEAELTGIPGINLIRRHPSLDRSHYVRYPILVGNDRRDTLCRHLISKGFEASPMYVEHGMRIDAREHPGAARICAELLTLPCHPFMTKSDLTRLASTTRTFLQR